MKKGITNEVPTAVTLENVHYHEFETGGPTCIYNSDGEFQGSSRNGDGYFALGFDTLIKDPNGVLYERISWGKYNPRLNPIEGKKNEYKTDMSMMGTREQDYGNSPLIVEVADWQGNVITHEFTLDEIIKKSKPYLVRKKINGHCPVKIK